jgi:hypothetical protein
MAKIAVNTQRFWVASRPRMVPMVSRTGRTAKYPPSTQNSSMKPKMTMRASAPPTGSHGCFLFILVLPCGRATVAIPSQQAIPYHRRILEYPERGMTGKSPAGFDRRTFLTAGVAAGVGGGGLVLGIRHAGRREAAAVGSASGRTFAPNAFVRVASDDTVTQGRAEQFSRLSDPAHQRSARDFRAS